MMSAIHIFQDNSTIFAQLKRKDESTMKEWKKRVKLPANQHTLRLEEQRKVGNSHLAATLSHTPNKLHMFINKQQEQLCWTEFLNKSY